MAAAVGAADEQVIARRILSLEREVDGMLREIPAAAVVLAHPLRAGRTRAVAVDRLREVSGRLLRESREVHDLLREGVGAAPPSPATAP